MVNIGKSISGIQSTSSVFIYRTSAAIQRYTTIGLHANYM